MCSCQLSYSAISIREKYLNHDCLHSISFIVEIVKTFSAIFLTDFSCNFPTILYLLSPLPAFFHPLISAYFYLTFFHLLLSAYFYLPSPPSIYSYPLTFASLSSSFTHSYLLTFAHTSLFIHSYPLSSPSIPLRLPTHLPTHPPAALYPKNSSQ